MTRFISMLFVLCKEHVLKKGYPFFIGNGNGICNGIFLFQKGKISVNGNGKGE